MKRVQITKKAGFLIMFYGGLGVFLLLTDPKNLPIGLLLLPVAWLFLCLFIATRYIVGKLLGGNRGFSRSRQYSLAFLLAVFPSLLLLLKSIDQLTWRDSLLLLAIVGFAVFYAERISFVKRNT